MALRSEDRKSWQYQFLLVAPFFYHTIFLAILPFVHFLLAIKLVLKISISQLPRLISYLLSYFLRPSTL